MGTINTSMQAVQKAQIDLGEVDNLPPLGQDMVLYSVQCTYNLYICNSVQRPTVRLKVHFLQNSDVLRGLPVFLGIKGLDPEQDGRVQA